MTKAFMWCEEQEQAMVECMLLGWVIDISDPNNPSIQLPHPWLKSNLSTDELDDGFVAILKLTKQKLAETDNDPSTGSSDRRLRETARHEGRAR